MDYPEIIPHSCLYLDTSWKDIVYGLQAVALNHHDRDWVLDEITELWTTPANPNRVLTCFSVRTGLDLFLRVKKFPRGSEVIMSAINIGAMVEIVRHHGLKPVPCDVSLDSLAPKIELLDSLVTDKTVAILVAHIYGKQCDLSPWVDAARKYNVCLIEDAAEGFCGLKTVGNPNADVTFFSFGSIKFYTAFGGAICKIRDQKVHEEMSKLYSEYPMQPTSMYLQKLIKSLFIYIALNCPKFAGTGYSLLRTFGMGSPKAKMVSMLRSFPDDQLIFGIRHQPCTPLLAVLLHRLKNFDAGNFNITQVKGEYITRKMPKDVTVLGRTAHVRNFWLFPILSEDPDELVKRLWSLGVDAFRGASALCVIEPTNNEIEPGATDENKLHHMITHDPLEAKYLFDHVLYLPVNKHVSFHHLDTICKALELALRQMREERADQPMKVPSKL